jgi:hypothetical protein
MQTVDEEEHKGEIQNPHPYLLSREMVDLRDIQII